MHGVRQVIELYSGDPHLIRLVREAASGITNVEVYTPKWRDLPTHADYAVTSGQLSAGVERFSAGLGAMTVVLPEGGYYLAQRASQGRYVAIGTDYRRVKF